MYRRQFIGLSGAVAVAAIAGASRFEARAQAAYSAVDLGSPEGFESITPIALNNNGVVVMSATNADETAIFLVENGRFSRISAEGEIPYATSINDANQVGGWVAGANDGTSATTDVPILFTMDGQVEMPGDRIDGRVHSVASDGRAVGEAAVDEAHAARRAVIWDNQEVSELKGTPDDGASSANDMNSLGQMVGWIGADDGSQRKAVIFGLDADPVELGALGGNLSEAVAISEQGMIVGNSSTSDEQTDLNSEGVAAFAWADGTMAPLLTMQKQSWSKATDVNSVGLVTGSVGLAAPASASLATTAVVWASDAVLDLNQIVQPIDGITLTDAIAINELGQVLCAGVDGSGASHAILLSILGN